jgi:hypothetical protein
MLRRMGDYVEKMLLSCIHINCIILYEINC